MDALRALDAPVVREVRGLGMMIGVETKEKVNPFLQALAAQGVLAIGGGSNVLRLLPPLVIPEDQWAYAIDAVGRVLTHG
jgi:acetylornithine/LysW-gamma-L-lysine aminotransferase